MRFVLAFLHESLCCRHAAAAIGTRRTVLCCDVCGRHDERSGLRGERDPDIRSRGKKLVGC